MAGPIPIPLHIGYADPSSPSDEHGQLEASRRSTTLTDPALDWQQFGVKPHWLGAETANCVAALEPAQQRGRGREEFLRMSAGAKTRGEMALVICTLGQANDDAAPPSTASAKDTLLLPGFQGSVVAHRLPFGARPRLADDLNTAERDLGKRLLSRADSKSWWTLALGALAREAPGVQTVFPRPGALEPVLVDALGKPVVAAWVPAHEQHTRWYIVPGWADWTAMIDWLVQQAIPYYVPEAPRRFRLAGFVDPSLQTPREVRAREALAAMEARHHEERALLEVELEQAQRAADVVRDGLLYGSGAELVRAVDQVLTDAGLRTLDLDAGEKGTWSADLLVSVGGQPRLLEVKSEGGRAKEGLVGDLLKHLDTWKVERPDQPVSGGTLIVNYQRKTAPHERDRQAYNRPEFVRGLTVKVVGTLDLFHWWKTSDWPTIRDAVLDEPVSVPNHRSIATAETGEPAATKRRGNWLWRRGT